MVDLKDELLMSYMITLNIVQILNLDVVRHLTNDRKRVFKTTGFKDQTTEDTKGDVPG